MTNSMLNLQADLIDQECKVIEVSIWACETNGLPETARSLRLTVEILRHSAALIRLEAQEECEATR